MDRLFAEILRDLSPRVVRAESLLVDVLLEDVAQYVGVDLVVLAAGRVVEMPGVTVEEVEQILECAIGNSDLGVLLLDSVPEEQAAVEVLDLSEKPLCLADRFSFGLAKPSKKSAWRNSE